MALLLSIVLKSLPIYPSSPSSSSSPPSTPTLVDDGALSSKQCKDSAAVMTNNTASHYTHITTSHYTHITTSHYIHITPADDPTTTYKTLLEVSNEKETNDLVTKKDSYERHTKALADWMQCSMDKMKDRNFVDSVESIKQQLSAFHNYRVSEKKHCKVAELIDLEFVFGELCQTELSINKNNSSISHCLSFSELTALWLKLEKMEQERADILCASLYRRLKMNYLLEKYNIKIIKFRDWMAIEYSYFKQQQLTFPKASQFLSVVQIRVKNLEFFQSEYCSIGTTFEINTIDLLQELKELEYEDIETLFSCKEALISGP